MVARKRSIVVVAVLGVSVACRSEPPPPIVVPPPSPSATPPVRVEPVASAPPAVSSAPAAEKPKDTCAADDDCVISVAASCCACCPCQAPHATTKAADKAREAQCAVVECAGCKGQGTCPACVDPQKEGMAARCRDQRCILVETSAPKIACKTDDDCWVDGKTPIARPPQHRGKKLRPCKDAEKVPACTDGVCVVRAFKC